MNYFISSFIKFTAKYMTTTSHKGIGILYLYSGWLGGFFGFFLSIWIRLEMNFQGLAIVRKVKELNFYNHVISVHGLVMLFAFIMPVAIGGYGNLLLPVMIGSAELTMPRLNGVSYWLYFMGAVTLVIAGFFFEKPLCAGWTLYPPLSTRDSESSSVSTDFGIFTLHLLGLSSGLGSFNFLSTAKHQRHVGLTLIGVNIYVWAIIITSLLLVGALPILGVGLTGLLLDRNFATSIYDGVLGGDPVLYQHLFWFFGHPEVYVIIIPIFGLVSNILTGICHKELFGREGMIYCIGAIGIVGFFVWAHHMMTVGLDIDSRAYFSAATAIISIPTAVKIFSYASTWTGSRAPRASSISWSFWSFLICFTLGGFSGLVLSSAVLDQIFHDTLFVVAHFHTVLSLGAVFGLLTSQYYFFSIYFGISNLEGNQIYQVALTLLGACLVFFPMHWLGLAGMSRRVPEFIDMYQPSYTIGFTGTILLIWAVIIIVRNLYISVTKPVFASYR